MYKKKLLIVGSQGIPAKYGGFETLVYFLVKYLAEKYDITVICSAFSYDKKISTYMGSKLIYLPFKSNGMQSVIYDAISILFSFRYEKVLVLGASGGIIMPIFLPFRKKFIANIGGLDWKREKWGKLSSCFLKISEQLLVRCSKTIISDNEGIRRYIKDVYRRDSFLIEYGGDQVNNEMYGAKDLDMYPFLCQRYALCVARIQPDNNIDIIISAFKNIDSIKLVIIGNWDSSYYGSEIKSRIYNDNIILLDAIYDQKILDIIRNNCYVYIHGHSAGGTNPALVEAMNLGLPIIAYSSGFNENTTENKAIYFKSIEELQEKLHAVTTEVLDDISVEMLEIAKRRYRWDIIANKYANCINK